MNAGEKTDIDANALARLVETFPATDLHVPALTPQERLARAYKYAIDNDHRSVSVNTADLKAVKKQKSDD